jgi:hypothetical protein
METAKPLQFLELMKAMFDCGGNTRQWSDGSEDDIVWEDDVEDKDDSDWVESTDNDSVMSHDGESDE